MTPPPAWRRAGLLAVLAVVAGAAGAGAQDPQQDVTLEIREIVGRPVRLAVPALQALPGAAAEAALIHHVLWDDLQHSMAFELVDRDRYPDAAPGEPTPWETWRSTGAEALILGVVSRNGDEVIAEFRLFDVASGQQVDGLQVPQTLRRARRIAHRFSDRAVLYYTGIAGVADSKIAFVSDRAFSEGSFYKEIYLMDYDGELQQRITNDNTIDLAPAISPAGDRIVYTSYKQHGSLVNVDLYVAFASGGRTQPLVTCRGTNSAPAFSPDARWLAFSSSCSGNPEIVRIPADGGEPRRLTLTPSSETSPSWAPNGRQIAFTSNRGGTPQIYTMDADGTNVRRLQTVRGQKDDPAWRPVDGDLIAFTASTGGNNFDIFVYDLRTGRTLQLTHGTGRKEAPAWSPDGRQIAFEWTRGDTTQIWAMGLDGSRQRMLTRDGNNFSPAWGTRP